MKMRSGIFSAAICAIWVAVPAQAYDCRLTTECFEAEVCADTDFEVSLEPAPDNRDAMILKTPSETLEAVLSGNLREFFLVAKTARAVHLFSLDVAGAARYTVHMSGPISVTYLGQCGAPQ